MKKNSQLLRKSTILAALFIGCIIGVIITALYYNYAYSEGKKFQSKDQLCSFVAQSFLLTLNDPEIRDQAIAIETRLYNLCLTDIANNDVSVKPRDRTIEYKVLQDDTINSIAEKFGISIDTIRWENNIHTKAIQEGSIIRIPPVTGVVHTVVEGDTIYSIANQYDIGYESILNFPYNEFKDYNTLELIVGSSIVVPGGTIK